VTKKKANPMKGGRKPIPKEDRVVPLNLSVKPATRDRFKGLAKELKLSMPKTLEHLMDENEKR